MIKSIDNLIEGLKDLENDLVYLTDNLEKQRKRMEAEIEHEKEFKEECIKVFEKYK